MNKKYLFSILFLFFVNYSYADLDYSDKIPNNVKSLGASGSFYVSFYREYGGYELDVIYTQGSFKYEKYFKEKWSFNVNPTIGFTFFDSYNSFNVGAYSRFRRYFNKQHTIPYLSFGIYTTYILSDFDDPFHIVDIAPSLSIGLIKEIKDDFYFDLSLGIPTMVSLRFGSGGANFGLTDFQIPISFGFKKYFGYKK